MKNWRSLVAVAVVLNFMAIGALLLRQGNEPPQTLGSAASGLVSTPTMEEARYDLSSRGGELNVILISLDALRYDYTGLGGEGGNTRNLDRFAEEAVVFHDATAAAPWTLPSHMSIWTARWPSVHQVTNKLKLLATEQMVENSLSPGIETYPGLLAREGMIAGGFTGGAGVQKKYGFGSGFDAYLDDKYFGGFDHSMPAALEWIRKNRDSRFFLFLHGYDVHGQYPLAEGSLAAISTKHDSKLGGGKEENAELREAGLSAILKPGDEPDLSERLGQADAEFLQEIYAAKVRDADQRVGNFLGQLRSLGLLDRSIVVIMSDHGDEFMEHGSLDHGATLYQEQLHVPLMIRFPGYARRHDVQSQVRTIDIFPTVFDALGLEGPTGVDGESLLPLLRGEEKPLPVFSETDYRLFRHLRSMRRGSYKLILDLQDGEKELYDLSKDPGETTDISSSEPRITYEMEQTLRKWMDETRTNPQDYLGVRQNPISVF
jgi:choline-sulfatase